MSIFNGCPDSYFKLVGMITWLADNSIIKNDTCAQLLDTVESMYIELKQMKAEQKDAK